MPYITHVPKGEIMTYEVRCPSDPYENTSLSDYDYAMDLCYALSQEYGYAEVTEWVGSHRQVIASYSYEWGGDDEN